MKQLVIIGAGGHGQVVADIARLVGYKKIIFLDDDENNHLSNGKVCSVNDYGSNYDFFVAIGDNKTREILFNKIKETDKCIVNLIHPKAIVANDVIIGSGVVIMAGAVVNTGAIIGDGVILNTCCSVDHNCKIGDFVHVSVGVNLAGTVCVEKRTFIGAGVTVINNIFIVKDSIIGAGAVVVNNIVEKGIFVGVPAKKMIRNKNWGAVHNLYFVAVLNERGAA